MAEGRKSKQKPVTCNRSQFRLSEDISADLDAQTWYHGMVTRDDLPAILICKGDFLVRTSQVDPEKPDVRNVISVMWEPKTADPIKHFVILRSTGGKFYLSESSNFGSISGLVSELVGKRVPLDGSGNAPMLISGVPRAAWELEHEQVELGEKLGRGAFGEVYKGLLHQAKRETIAVAVKSCVGKGTKEERIAFMKEARIMRQYDHRNVIKILGVAAQKEPLLLVLELAPGGSLLAHLKKTWPGLKQKEQLRLIFDVAKGMEYLEKRSCIHRDLAARNCLLGKDKEVKIADFGLASIAKQEQLTEGLRLPIKWTAPEAILDCAFSSKSDVWSVGILVTEVWSGGAEPYPGKTVKDIKKGVPEGLRNASPTPRPPRSRSSSPSAGRWSPRPDPTSTTSESSSPSSDRPLSNSHAHTLAEYNAHSRSNMPFL